MPKKFWIYLVILLLLAGTAVWVFWPREDYRDLKEQTAVAADPAAEKLVKAFLAAARDKDKSRLGRLMLIRDSTDLERYSDPFWGREAEPVRFLGFTRLKHSSKNNLTAVVYSEPLGRSFSFTLVETPDRQLRVYSVGGSRRTR